MQVIRENIWQPWIINCLLNSVVFASFECDPNEFHYSTRHRKFERKAILAWDNKAARERKWQKRILFRNNYRSRVNVFGVFNRLQLTRNVLAKVVRFSFANFDCGDDVWNAIIIPPFYFILQPVSFQIRFHIRIWKCPDLFIFVCTVMSHYVKLRKFGL